MSCHGPCFRTRELHEMHTRISHGLGAATGTHFGVFPSPRQRQLAHPFSSSCSGHIRSPCASTSRRRRGCRCAQRWVRRCGGSTGEVRLLPSLCRASRPGAQRASPAVWRSLHSLGHGPKTPGLKKLYFLRPGLASRSHTHGTTGQASLYLGLQGLAASPGSSHTRRKRGERSRR